VGIDGVSNASGTELQVALNGAEVLNAIPEPGAASLLGLGIVLLVLAAGRTYE